MATSRTEPKKPKGTWGGKRAGAGRKRKPGSPWLVPHRAVPPHAADCPVRITLRSALGTLGTPRVAAVVARAIEASGSRSPSEFRVVCFGIDADRVELVVEARSKRSLSWGVRSVTIRIARTVNEHLAREGRLWADRWHGRELVSAKEVRDATREIAATRVHANGAEAPRTRLGKLARLRAGSSHRGRA